MRKPSKSKVAGAAVIRARLLNADDAASMTLMALQDHLTTINKLVSIAKLLGCGREAWELIQNWASEEGG